MEGQVVGGTMLTYFHLSRLLYFVRFYLYPPFRFYFSKSEKRSKSSHTSSNGSGGTSSRWLHPYLRVRVIDPEYSHGKYFKEKVTIEDVVSLDECICRTDKGKIIEGTNGLSLF